MKKTKHIEIDPDGTEHHYENGKKTKVVYPEITEEQLNQIWKKIEKVILPKGFRTEELLQEEQK